MYLLPGHPRTFSHNPHPNRNIPPLVFPRARTVLPTGLTLADKFSAVDTLNRFIMTTAHSVHTTDVYGAQSPSSSRLPVSRDSLADPDEISPLLGTNHADAIQSSQSERWHSARSSFSAFLDNNAGLCLIASSQFFFSAMIICVKWLNNLDEPVPILEVCVSFKMVVF